LVVAGEQKFLQAWLAVCWATGGLLLVIETAGLPAPLGIQQKAVPVYTTHSVYIGTKKKDMIR
jgi:hypothetical protein